MLMTRWKRCIGEFESGSRGQDGFHADARSLVDDNQRTKAACWAFFAGEEEPAVKILMRSVGKWLDEGGSCCLCPHASCCPD
jgi:hypothetical protein